MTASDLVKSRNSPGSILDGCLFFVRHMLILKEIMYNLEVDLRQRDEGKEIERSSRAVEVGLTGGVTGASVLFFFFIVFWVLESDEGFLASLSNMFKKTTSLLAEGLFASLEVSRVIYEVLKLYVVLFFFHPLFEFLMMRFNVGYRSKSKTSL